MKPKIIIGVVSIVLFTSLLMYNFGNSIDSYVNFEQANDRANSHVIGTWESAEHYGFSRETMQFSFHMKDQDGNVRRVVYPRPKPNNFEQATQLVVVGEMRNNVFHANEMLMKCPSKYNDPSELELVNSRDS
ncbi:MAG: cytochrome c maturation protein CcmE [Balneolaceae bacterium]|jgi:cytochrome c-type biogenesis protein CcmE|nr:cytochrome c maturation protein CcmE [Balneolaceae bacterium]